MMTAALLTGCNDKPAPPDAAPPPPKKGLFVADAHVETSALALGTTGESATRVIVSTTKLPCDYFTGRYPQRPAHRGGLQLDFWLVQPLEKTGSDGAWVFRGGQLIDRQGGRGLITRGAMLDDVVAASDTVDVSGMELAFTDPTGKRELIWSGDLKAKDCGRVKRHEPVRPQPDLVLKIAGRSFAIGGASVVTGDDQFFIRLTRAPHDCDSDFGDGFDFYVDLVVKGDPPALQFVSLNGALFPETPSGSGGGKTFELAFDGPLEGHGAVRVDVDGTIDARGYGTSLKGSFEAMRCTPGDAGAPDAAPDDAARSDANQLPPAPPEPPAPPAPPAPPSPPTPVKPPTPGKPPTP